MLVNKDLITLYNLAAYANTRRIFHRIDECTCRYKKATWTDAQSKRRQTNVTKWLTHVTKGRVRDGKLRRRAKRSPQAHVKAAGDWCHVLPVPRWLHLARRNKHDKSFS